MSIVNPAPHSWTDLFVGDRIKFLRHALWDDCPGSVVEAAMNSVAIDADKDHPEDGPRYYPSLQDITLVEHKDPSLCRLCCDLQRAAPIILPKLTEDKVKELLWLNEEKPGKAALIAKLCKDWLRMHEALEQITWAYDQHPDATAFATTADWLNRIATDALDDVGRE